jgi:hypothetical protein
LGKHRLALRRERLGALLFHTGLERSSTGACRDASRSSPGTASPRCRTTAFEGYEDHREKLERMLAWLARRYEVTSVGDGVSRSHRTDGRASSRLDG